MQVMCIEFPVFHIPEAGALNYDLVNGCFGVFWLADLT